MPARGRCLSFFPQSCPRGVSRACDVLRDDGETSIVEGAGDAKGFLGAEREWFDEMFHVY